MKKNILYALAFSVMVFTGCEDNRDADLPGDQVYLSRHGLTEEVAYAVGEEATLDLWTNRSGLNNSSCTVEYTISPAVLTTYNAENGTAYKMLPESCYTLGEHKLVISGKDHYAKFRLKYSPEKIAELAGYGESEYVLPFEIKVDGLALGDVEDGNIAIVRFDIRKPTIQVTQSAMEDITIPSGGEEIVETGITTITADFINKWDIDLTISNDAALVDAYNEANGTNYQTMPSGSYTQEPATVALKAGEQSVNVKYKIDRTKLQLGSKYLLPVQLKSTSKFYIHETKYIRYIEVEYVDPIIPQSNWEVHDYRDTEVGDGDGPGALIDDDITSYWHAQWSSGSLLPSWITVKLTDMSKTATVSQVELYARQNNASGPKTVEIWTSMDGENFTLAGTLAFQNVTTVQKVVLDHPVQARYVKMNITEKNNNSVAMGEMYVRGVIE